MLYKAMFLVYVLATVLYGVGIVVGLRSREKLAKGIGWIAFTALATGLGIGLYMMGSTWLDSGQPPFRTLFQSLVFLSVTTSLVYVVVGKRSVLLGFASAGFVLLILGFAFLKQDVEEVQLPPALQSVWFVPHVLVYFLGYAALFISFVTSILSLVFPQPKQLPFARSLGIDELNFSSLTYRSILFGFAMISAGLIMGALWAKYAWGDWWSWDPKENWALVTWLVYAAFLHLRLVAGVGRKALAWVSIAGFLAMMFTYIGVNYLPAVADTLHAYQ